MTLILASASPRRRELLARLGLPFAVLSGSGEERPARPGENPVRYAQELARDKAAEIAQRFPEGVVLAADTVVVSGSRILGKPDSTDSARAMLLRLRGKPHRVVTGVAVYHRQKSRHDAVSAMVYMGQYDDAEIDRYITTGEPMDKAGAYAVQGQGARLVDHVEGCLETVVGLPLCLTARMLREETGLDVTAECLCHHLPVIAR